MVAAEAKTRPPRVLALGFVADQARAARRLLNRLFADPAAGVEETHMTALAAKCLARIIGWRRQLRAALPAAMP
jgi:hypothetical protein